MCASGSPHRPPPDMWRTTGTRTPSISMASRPLCSPTETARPSLVRGGRSLPVWMEGARTWAAEAGVAANPSFEVAKAKTYPGTNDLVAFSACLHDMGDPVGASAHVRETLKPDGPWMIVEP